MVPCSADLQAKGTHTFMVWGVFLLPAPPGPPTFISGPGLQLCQKQNRPNTPMFRKRILKESQKNGNLICLFQAREKTSFPKGSRLWLGDEEGRPSTQALGRHRKGPCQALGWRHVQPSDHRT